MIHNVTQLSRAFFVHCLPVYPFTLGKEGSAFREGQTFPALYSLSLLSPDIFIERINDSGMLFYFFFSEK